MSNERVRTFLRTADGESFRFKDYFVRRHARETA